MPITVTIPTIIEPHINTGSVVSKAGHTIAGLVRKRLRAGLGKSGQIPSKDGSPLRETGALIKSIKFMKRGKVSGIVGASGTRPDGKSNAKIFWIHWHRMKGLRNADPMGVSQEFANAAQAAAQKEIHRQIRKKEAKLVAKGKKTI